MEDGVRGLAHVLVLCDDLERSRAFYVTALGLRVGDRPPLPFAGEWLYADGTCCLHLAARGPYRAHARRLGLDVPEHGDGHGAIDHVAFTATDVDAVRARLTACGASAVHHHEPGGPHQLFLEDPDGQRVEISVAG